MNKFITTATLSILTTGIFISDSVLFSNRAVAGEVNRNSAVSTLATDLGKPLTMNCQIATLTMKEFFFVEQNGQQVAVDCASMISLPEQNKSIGDSSPLEGSVNLEVPLNRPEVSSDRFTLFRTSL